MIIRGITEEQLTAALAAANQGYDGNLRFGYLGTKGRSCQFVLRTHDSRKSGSRRSWRGRHMPCASWHAHRDLFRAVFKINRDAVIITAMARYDGSDDFERKFPRTYYQNAGSQANPVAFGDLSVI